MKAINIKWDVDNPKDLDALPSEIVILDDIDMDDEDDEDAVSDYISDLTGFCHYGFSLVEE